MNKKELIINLVNSGFTLQEALKMAEPEQEPEQEPGTAEIMAAINAIKKSVDTMTEVTRATARLYNGGEKKTSESAEDILSKLG